ncbi:MAG: hypothetical protein ACI8P7_001440 [Candidatus Azotimanducaceae bacterium]|jgi:hypothetical protein
MHKIIILSSFLLMSILGAAQELNCTVRVLSQNIQGSNKQVFNTLQSAVFQFMNNKKWTNDVFEVEERIECIIEINVQEQSSADQFKGSITVQASRPVYNSSYSTTLLNIIDNNFEFRYLEFQNLDFNENSSISNLTSVLAYYANVIIGLDYDTFSPRGGTAYFSKAQNIVNNAQQDGSGWQAFENNRNRYWLIENILNPAFEPYRDMLYKYHRSGLDKMTTKLEEARKAALESLLTLRGVHQKKPGNYIMMLFFDAKSDEIVNMFQKDTPANKNKLLSMLKMVDPSNLTKWETIMRSN